MDRGVLPTGELPALIRDRTPETPDPADPVHDQGAAVHRRRRVPAAPVLSGFRQAIDTARDVNPGLLARVRAAAAGAVLLLAADAGDARHRGSQLSMARIFRIQLSTKALSNIVPGGNAASSALGYRLMTLSGISGPDAGFALATAGIGSAVVLNIIFWTGLIMSVPFRGVNEAYSSLRSPASSSSGSPPAS
jgi:uncharacterized membrane protein